ncbi:MAG: NAD(P)/FAD-dependent oxidoreductase [Aureliella sp.]
MQSVSTIVIGAGIAGLRCAVALKQAGKSFFLVESGDSVGGRMRTDEVDGFRLDRGFHVLQTSYPELDGVVDFAALQITSLEPGAMIRHAGRWARMSDPWRRPQHAFSTLLNGVGSVSDRWKLMRLRSDALSSPDFPDPASINSDGQDRPASAWLKQSYGFSDEFIELFLRPWWSGVFLEEKLETSAAFMRFVFKMLSSDTIAYPAQGIQAIPNQLSTQLPQDSIRLGDSAENIEVSSECLSVSLSSGEQISGERLVLATPMHVSEDLLAPLPKRNVAKRELSRSHTQTSCLYFSVDVQGTGLDSLPAREPVLMLNGDRTAGPVNHVFPQSFASKRSAPDGKELMSVNLVGEQCFASEGEVRAHLSILFGESARDWSLVRRYDLPHALPAQPPGFRDQRETYIYKALDRVVCCGDYVGDASLNGAMRSGREAAEWAIGGWG